MSKQRQGVIRKIIKEKRISTLDELGFELNEQGFNASKTTISRDIKALNLIKKNGYYIFSDDSVRKKSRQYLSLLLNQSEFSYSSPSRIYHFVLNVPNNQEELISNLITDIFVEVNKDLIGVVPGKGFILILSTKKSAFKNLESFINRYIKSEESSIDDSDDE